jgi:hypothetical protein
VPAAAVIPAPIAYINAVAVKKLVVGFGAGGTGGPSGRLRVPSRVHPSDYTPALCRRKRLPCDRGASLDSGSQLPRQPRAQGPSADVTVNKTACPKQSPAIWMFKHGMTTAFRRAELLLVLRPSAGNMHVPGTGPSGLRLGRVVGSIETAGVVRISWSGVKSLDPGKTNNGEGIPPECLD